MTESGKSVGVYGGVCCGSRRNQISSSLSCPFLYLCLVPVPGLALPVVFFQLPVHAVPVFHLPPSFHSPTIIPRRKVSQHHQVSPSSNKVHHTTLTRVHKFVIIYIKNFDTKSPIFDILHKQITYSHDTHFSDKRCQLHTPA